MRHLPLLLLTLLLAACSTTPPQAISMVMNGVEVWTSGTPSRPYHVIDTIQRAGSDQSVTYAQEEALMAQEARTRGADAIIVTSAVMIVVRQDIMAGRPILAPKVTAELIRYQ